MNKDLENPKNKGMEQARHSVLGKGRLHTTYPVSIPAIWYSGYFRNFP